MIRVWWQSQYRLEAPRILFAPAHVFPAPRSLYARAANFKRAAREPEVQVLSRALHSLCSVSELSLSIGGSHISCEARSLARLAGQIIEHHGRLDSWATPGPPVFSLSDRSKCPVSALEIHCVCPVRAFGAVCFERLDECGLRIYKSKSFHHEIARY